MDYPTLQDVRLVFITSQLPLELQDEHSLFTIVFCGKGGVVLHKDKTHADGIGILCDFLREIPGSQFAVRYILHNRNATFPIATVLLKEGHPYGRTYVSASAKT